MNETAQIIWASLSGVAVVLLALPGVIWAIRCNPNKPFYRQPRLKIFSWRDKGPV